MARAIHLESDSYSERAEHLLLATSVVIDNNLFSVRTITEVSMLLRTAQ